MNVVCLNFFYGIYEYYVEIIKNVCIVMESFVFDFIFYWFVVVVLDIKGFEI